MSLEEMYRNQGPAMTAIHGVYGTEPTPRDNHLLAILPAETYNSIKGSLKLVEMPLGYSLGEPGVELQYAYFPVDSIVALLCLTANGDSAEISVVGFEGMFGVSLFMGGNTTTSRAIVVASGHAYRLPASVLKAEFHRGGAMQRLLLRYTMALLTQMSMTAVCNRHHSVDQQLCRWLLLSHDRWFSSELIMTQELIANLLGVRREGICEAARKLQKAGLIEYHRGHVHIRDRAGLEARSCECYGVIQQEYERLLSHKVVD